MKIDAVLARHPWPWHIRRYDDSVSGSPRSYWQVEDAKGRCVFDDGSGEGELIYSCDPKTRDAILELVEAHVAAAGRSSKEGEEGKQ